jgi:hypothetical protein
MWACDFYNIRSVYHFTTREEAEAYGQKAGFQFSVYEEKNAN